MYSLFLVGFSVFTLFHGTASIQCYAANGTLDQKDMPDCAVKVNCNGCDFCVDVKFNENNTNLNEYTQTRFWDCGCKSASNSYNNRFNCAESGGTTRSGTLPGLAWYIEASCCNTDFCNKDNSGGKLHNCNYAAIIFAIVLTPYWFSQFC